MVFDTDGRFQVAKGVVKELMDDRGLSDTLVADQDNLSFFNIIFRLVCVSPVLIIVT